MGVDMGASGMKVVRIRKTDAGMMLMAADVLPAFTLGSAAGGDGVQPTVPPFPKTLLTNYAAVAYSTEKSVVRVVTLPGPADSPEDTEKSIRENLGLDSSYRVSFAPTPGKPKETKLVTVAIPETDIAALLTAFSSGPPAAYSLEISGVVSLNACLMGPAAAHPGDAICALDCGARTTMMAIFNKGGLVLTRKLDVGGEAVLTSIQKQLGVDRAMAESILSQGAIDVSQSVRSVIEPFLRQVTISRDYVERQENCRISTLYLSGGMSLSASWNDEVMRATGMEARIWNPFENVQIVQGAIPERLQGQEPRFAAAMGAAVGALNAT